jgi:[protein-PII] uridylyltransferase
MRPRIRPPRRLEQLIGLLWDIGLDIGHSVRSIDQCLDEAERDITVKTALLEARYLAGSRALYDDFEQSCNATLDRPPSSPPSNWNRPSVMPSSMTRPTAWSPTARKAPAAARPAGDPVGGPRRRHRRRLEITGPRRTDHGRGTPVRTRRLLLAELRIELHLLAGRREDRLLFDHQESWPWPWASGRPRPSAPPEVLMQRYYQNAKLVTQLNSLVMQVTGRPPAAGKPGPPIVIDAHFQMVRDLLDVRDEEVFQRHPRAILECFLLQMQRSEIKGMTPRTQRALWRSQGGIDAAFRRDPATARCSSAVPAEAPDASDAAHEPVRHPRPLPAGLRPHRRPDAARPVPRLHRRPAHPAWWCATCAASPCPNSPTNTRSARG